VQLRLGFAVAAHLDPDVLLLDEIFAVGDAAFQRRCFGTLQSFRAQGKTILFVSHTPGRDPDDVRSRRVLEHGQLRFDWGVEDGLAFYEGLTAEAAAT
jgi:ABC-type polysaccharide/polyol phosphate transport system ATPase subunit